jgi:hypothetical protein
MRSSGCGFRIVPQGNVQQGRRLTNTADPQELAELFDREPGIARDAAHRKRLDRVMPRNGDNPCSIGHHYVLALANDADPAFSDAEEW